MESYQDDSDAQPAFGQLHDLYSRFWPVVQEENRRGRARYPVASGSTQAEGSGDDLTASLTVELDEGEMFSQLCCVTNLVKTGPRRGLFLSHVNINDGVVRVFRKWLAARAKGDKKEDPILWTDRNKTVGLRFGVTENTDRLAQPAIWSETEDEDLPMSYTLVYEELLVRTTALLLEVEKSEVQEVNSTGKAIIIASL